MDSLAQAYNWTFEDIRKLTFAQVIMLNHAADVNKKRIEFRSDEKRVVSSDGDTGPMAPPYPNQGPPRKRGGADRPVYNGKRLSELTSAEYVSYLKAGL